MPDIEDAVLAAHVSRGDCLHERSHPGVRHLSPLMLTCIEANREGVRAILSRQDVDVNIIGKDGVTAIGLACLQGDLEIVKMLLECPGVNINNMTVDGVTPFTVSIFKGHLDITRLLLQRPELELGGSEEREIDPLHVAAAKGQLDIVTKLIRFGVEIDRSRPGSHTAIPVTMMKCRNPAVMINIVLSLVEAGCHPTVDNVRLAIRKAPQVGAEGGEGKRSRSHSSCFSYKKSSLKPPSPPSV